MSLTFTIGKAQDLFEKMVRDAGEMEKTVTGDRAFNFVVTAFHLKDWIEKDPLIPQSARDDLGTLSGNKYFQICRDLANASKHMVITRYHPSTAGTHTERGLGVGRLGKGPLGIGEESISITHSDGTVISILELKSEVVSLWKEFFLKHGI
jgi:hypothetical protein